MRPAARRRVLAAIAVALAAGAGCKEGGTGGGGEGPGGVPEMDAAEFYREYASLKGADLLRKYSGGVLVSGTVKKSVDLGKDEGYQLQLAVEGPGHIALKFQDGGAEARKKKLKPGEPVAAVCQINGKPDAILFLVGCTLK